MGESYFKRVWKFVIQYIIICTICTCNIQYRHYRLICRRHGVISIYHVDLEARKKAAKVRALSSPNLPTRWASDILPEAPRGRYFFLGQQIASHLLILQDLSLTDCVSSGVVAAALYYTQRLQKAGKGRVMKVEAQWRPWCTRYKGSSTHALSIFEPHFGAIQGSISSFRSDFQTALWYNNKKALYTV